MNKMEWNHAQVTRRYKLSGGVLQIPKSPAERLALVVRLRRLKADFLRRQEASR